MSITKLKLLKQALKGLREIYPLLKSETAKKKIVKEANRIKQHLASLMGKQHSPELFDGADFMEGLLGE